MRNLGNDMAKILRFLATKTLVLKINSPLLPKKDNIVVTKAPSLNSLISVVFYQLWLIRICDRKKEKELKRIVRKIPNKIRKKVNSSKTMFINF